MKTLGVFGSELLIIFGEFWNELFTILGGVWGILLIILETGIGLLIIFVFGAGFFAVIALGTGTWMLILFALWALLIKLEFGTWLIIGFLFEIFGIGLLMTFEFIIGIFISLTVKDWFICGLVDKLGLFLLLFVKFIIFWFVIILFIWFGLLAKARLIGLIVLSFMGILFIIFRFWIAPGKRLWPLIIFFDKDLLL